MNYLQFIQVTIVPSLYKLIITFRPIMLKKAYSDVGQNKHKNVLTCLHNFELSLSK